MSKLPWSLVDFQSRHLKQYYEAKTNPLHAAKSTGSPLYTCPNQLLQKLTRDPFKTMSQKDLHMHGVSSEMKANIQKQYMTQVFESFVFSTEVRSGAEL